MHDGDVWRVEVIPYEKASPYEKAGAVAGVVERRVEGEIGWDQAYVGANGKPLISILTPGSQGALADPSIVLAWRCVDPDGDAVVVDLYYDTDEFYGGQVMIGESLPGTGTMTWTPPESMAVGADLTGDGEVTHADLFRLAAHWQSGTEQSRKYRIFVRAWDTKMAPNSTYSEGEVIVTQTVPANYAGLMNMIDKWRAE